jgi:micrococcal nuclease
MNKAWIGAAVLGLALGAVAATKKPAPPKPIELAGTVSRVVDGDTLWLKTEGDGEAPVVVRLEGIDAPESCQPGGAESTAALTALALGRNVVVRVAARDEHGRSVGKVFDGGKDLGDRMVRDGQAWSSRYQYDRGPYVSEERMAGAQARLARCRRRDPAARLPQAARPLRRRRGQAGGGRASGNAGGRCGLRGQGRELRRPPVLFANDFLRRGHLVPEELPRRQDGRRPRRRAVRAAVVSKVKPARLLRLRFRAGSRPTLLCA